ncbi:uncharacterized protein EAF01_006911 [Botrytis porri]|uniref:uncharacterized protein n=1 Tax=Botrytis porri TaxID=87229 RepID=UPI0018FFF059|nr:uncharacterized protein EAF01_006911 [Botrytis porri]KAF7901612.1 hypothetical protein EAF01_006911 [Botrytis porri]
MATTTAPHVPPLRIIIRTREEMIRIRRLKRNLAKYPDVSKHAFKIRCSYPEFEMPTPIEKPKRDNISLGKNLGMTLFHRECLLKQLGVFGMVANSEERQRFYKNWVQFTKDGLEKDEIKVSNEYRRLRLNLITEKNRIRRRLCVPVPAKDKTILKKKLGEMEDEEEKAAAAYVRECKKLRMHRVKMEHEMIRIKDLLAEMSQYPQGDLPKIWGNGYDQASKNIGRRTNPEDSSEISDLV